MYRDALATLSTWTNRFLHPLTRPNAMTAFVKSPARRQKRDVGRNGLAFRLGETKNILYVTSCAFDPGPDMRRAKHSREGWPLSARWPHERYDHWRELRSKLRGNFVRGALVGSLNDPVTNTITGRRVERSSWCDGVVGAIGSTTIDSANEFPAGFFGGICRDDRVYSRTPAKLPVKVGQTIALSIP